MLYPHAHTVMDKRALASLAALGLMDPNADLNDPETYPVYLATCQGLADQLGVSLRELDKCLWRLNGKIPPT